MRVDIIYRKVTMEDLDEIISMRISQLLEEGAQETIDLKPHLRAYYEKHVVDGTFVSWLAFDGNTLIGTCGVSFAEKPPYFSCPSGRFGLLSSMYVRKEYRRIGIARTLLDLVTAEAKEQGCGMIQLTASDAGVLLYTDYGFKKNRNFMYYML